MDINFTVKVLSLISLIVSAGMLPPLVIALVDGTNDALPFALSISAGITVSALGWLVPSANRKTTHPGIREGVGVTGFSWIAASLVGALPFWAGGYVQSFADAFFETMSGFTTTGATIFAEIETLPRGILLWRSLTHWIGGMGIIVLSLAVLPFLGVSGMEMYKAEVPGVTAGKVAPRLHQTAVKLWSVYIILTAAEAVLLVIGGMSLFDAVCHSFSTIATGGFSTKNNSVAYFTSPFIQWVIIVFMFMSGINFSLYFYIPAKKFRKFLSDSELICYAGIAAVSSGAIALCLYFAGTLQGTEYIIRQALFHVISVMTTTGFIVEDYDLWPQFAHSVIIILMFIGACGGSTGGGCKVSRFMILGSCLKSEIKKLLHPRAVITPRLDGKPLAQETVNSAMSFFTLYMLLLGIGVLILTAFGIDIISAFTGVLTCLSNVGPGLNRLGTTEHFAWLPDFMKWVLSLCMLAGRLELFAVFLLFVPSAYRK